MMTPLMTSNAVQIETRPSGSVLIRPVGESMLVTCEAGHNLPIDQRARLRVGWFSEKTDREITAVHGHMYVETDDENSAVKKLYITELRAEDAAIYSCRVYSPDNSVEQKSVTLQLIQPITFEGAVSPQNPMLGTNAVIQCRAGGNPLPTVSWRFKGRRIGPDTSRRYQLLQDGLKILNVSERDNGQYMCRAEVESDGRYDDRRIDVQVFIPPHILSDPGDVLGLEGRSSSLQCTATGVPTPSISWYHCPMNVTTGESGDPVIQNIDQCTEVLPSERISINSTAGLLTFSPVSKSDDGRFVCRAESSAGRSQGVGQLKVQVKPSIYQFENASVVEGASLIFNCKSRGDPVPELRLISGTKNYRVGYSVEGRLSVVEKSPGHLQLVIQRAVLSDASEYICMASSSLGEDRSKAFLIVHYAPKFSSSSVDIVRSWPGQNLTLGCHSLGEPSPKHSWFKDDREIGNNFTYSFKNVSENRSTLTVRNSDQDSRWIYGRYSCRATNYLGETTKHYDIQEGKVPGAPSIFPDRVHPGRVDLNVTLPKDDGGVRVDGLICDVTGGNDDIKTIEHSINRSSVEGGMVEVMWEDLLPGTEYLFRVRARNAVGVGGQSEISVKTPPPKVPSPVWIVPPASECSEPTQCIVVWHRPLTGGLPIERYEISWRESTPGSVGRSGWLTGSLPIPPGTRTVRHILRGLRPSSVYEIQVTAYNSLGPSPVSIPVFIRTAPELVEGVVIDPLSIFHQLGPPSVVIVLGILAAVTLVLVIDAVCYCAADCGLIKCLCVHVCGRERGQGKNTEREKVPADESNRIALVGDVEAGRSEEARSGGNGSPSREKLAQIDEEPLVNESWLNSEAGPSSKTARDKEAELNDEQCRLLADHQDDNHDITVDVRERPVHAARKSILSTGDERWRSVVKELEKELGVQKSEEGEGDEGRPVIKLMSDSMHSRRPLSQGSVEGSHIPLSESREGIGAAAPDNAMGT